jgi:aminopeptidase N
MASDRDILPSAIKPSNYNLSLSNLEFGGNWTYDGLVKIQAKVNSSTSQIVLNTKFIDIKHVDVLQNDSAIASLKDVSYDQKNERATISLSKELPTGEAVLAIKFQGTMNDAMEGFYRAKYKPAETPAAGTPTDGTHHYMFSTQFEACTARRAFPCFDEPNLKASFEFDVEIPEDLVAISNMPVKGTSKGSKSGIKKVSFEKTPTMSTYVSIQNDYRFLLLTILN